MTEQQIRKKRMQKILARSSAASSSESGQYQSQAQPLINNKKETQNRDSVSSGYDMFKANKSYESFHVKLEIASVVLGIIGAIFHCFAIFLPSIISFILIILSLIILEVFRYGKVSKFITENPPSEDPLLKQIGQLKQLDIPNKLIHFMQSIKPLTKWWAAYLLTVLAYNCLYPVQK